MKPMTLRIRRWLLVLLTLVVLGVFTARLMNIQIVESETYQRMREGRYISTQTVKATRGEIVDRNGEPLAVNRMGYDVVLDRAYLPSQEQNDIILALIELCERLGEEWTDTLPITDGEPYSFKEGQDAEISRLKTMLDAQTYATADNAMYWLVQRYKLEEYTPEQQRKIASVRYEMEQRGFTWNVPYTFANDIDISSVIQIKERSYQLKGVEVVESAVRTHPNSTLAPHIIGLTGPIYAEEYEELDKTEYAMDDRLGKSGVERSFESILRGKNGTRQIYIGSGEVIQTVESEAPVPGNTVMLTLDNKLQQVSQDALERQIQYLQRTAPAGQGRESDSGAVVVMSVKTGEVLAAATYPSYDLDSYTQEYAKLVADEEGLRPLVNRAVQGGYAPGSTFKPVVATAGLAQGVIDESSPVSCTQVYRFYSGYQPTCLSYHGSINVNTALQKSCNIFFYDVGRRLQIEAVESYAIQYGLGQPTGIEIAERIGQVSGPAAKEADPYTDEEWYPGDTLQSSIGQMYNEYTPLQLANYAATIANRGTRMKVTLVHEIRDYSMNTVVEPFTPEVSGRVDASRQDFEVVIRGMIAASAYGGTASADFGAYPITVASKTGTPETNDLPNSTFICFAPAENPEIAIAVVIEKGWHGYTGAPVAKEIFNNYFGFDLPSSASPPKTVEEAPVQNDITNSESNMGNTAAVEPQVEPSQPEGAVAVEEPSTADNNNINAFFRN